MAVLSVRFRSQTLKRNVSMTVYLPTDKGGSFSRVNSIDKKYQTLYLLHGLQCDHTDWLYRSYIEKIAEECNIAVVMPSAENSFYINSDFVNDNFEDFIASEVVEESRRMFPLSDKYEDTFIGGVSMGGFGALRLGLKYCDKFCKILSFSAALHLLEFPVGHQDRQLVCDEDKVFGNLDEAYKSDKNPAVCLNNLKLKVEKNEAKFPDIYMICGLQDGLLAANRSFHKKLIDANVNVIYEEHDGVHSYSYWNNHVEKMVKWLVNL